MRREVAADLTGTGRAERYESAARIPQVPRGMVLRRTRRPDGTWDEELIPRRAALGTLRLELARRRDLPRRGRPFGALPGPHTHGHRYAWVPAGHVEPLVREVVAAEIALARARWVRQGHEPREVTLRWFRRDGVAASFSWPRAVSGLNDRRSAAIAVLATLDADEAARAARHELAHLEGATEDQARAAEVA